MIAITVSSQMGDTVIKDRGNTPAPEPTEVFRGLPPIQPTAMSVKFDEAASQPQVFEGVTPSIQRLHDVLGIPLDELQKMDGFEIIEIYKKNADVLGVQVWESRYDPQKGWVEELVAGSEIFDPLGKIELRLPTPP